MVRQTVLSDTSNMLGTQTSVLSHYVCVCVCVCRVGRWCVRQCCRTRPTCWGHRRRCCHAVCVCVCVGWGGGASDSAVGHVQHAGDTDVGAVTLYMCVYV